MNNEEKAEILKTTEKLWNERNRLAKLEKENEQLKKKISILLSCSNCQENKGGYVCEKEYNDKCLSQKIEYIKELKEEIAELKSQNKLLSEKVGFWEGQAKAKEAQIEEYDRLAMFDIARTDELEAQIEKMKCCQNCINMDCFGGCRKGISAERPFRSCNNWKLAE